MTPWWVNAISGGTQATLVTITGYPFDFVKARMQTRKYKNSWKCTVDVFKSEGYRAFYRGSAMPWLSHMIKRPIQYPVSEWMKAHKPGNGYLYNYFIGGLTGLIGPIFGTPLQVVKVATQTSSNETHANSLEFIKYNWKNYGVKGFYRGFIATCWKDGIFSASFVGNYYTFRDIFGCSTWGQNFFNGAAAHCLTWFLFMPIDYVKTHIQRSEKKTTVRTVIHNSYVRGGPFVFWSGVLPACLRTIPVSGVAMVGFEYTRRKLTELS